MEFVRASTGLRPYQRELLRKVLAALEITDRPVMMQLPTGGGKTVIAAHLLRDYLTGGRKAVWITHRRELKGQTLKTLKDMSGLKASAPYWPTNQVAPQQRNGVVILMAQTAGRRSDESYIPDDWISYIWSRYDENDLMIVDEAHHATAESWERAIRQWPGKVLGMTATPWRLSKKDGFDHLFGDLILGPQVGELQNDEFLCQANVLVPDAEGRILGGIVPSHLDYNAKSVEEANANKDVMTARALKFWQEHVADRQTIIYAVSIGHADNLAALFSEEGIPAEAIHTKTDADIRAQVISNFANGRLSVLVNVAIATEGFDLPNASCIVIARPTKSLSLYLQMVGRGLRPKSDGGDCLILDLVGNALEHGLPDDTREWSLAVRGESGGGGDAPVVLCEQCQTASPAASHSCKSCGAPFGKDCPRCGKWHAFRSGWLLEDLCPPDAHDSVCDQCHNDAHHKANLPRISPLEYIRHKGISLRESSFPHEDKQIVIAAVLEILLDMEGRGKRIIVIRKVADKLKDIFLETLLKAENSKSEARIVKRSYVERIYRNLLCSDNSPWGGKIPQGFKQLEKGGYCDRPAHGIWRLTESGREMAENIMLQHPNGDK